MDSDFSEYTNCAAEYSKAYVAEYDRERFLNATRLSVLREVLGRQTDYYIEYDAVVEGEIYKLQNKYTISDNKQFENHMLISVRDVTESTRERNAKKKELSEARVMAEAANRAKTTFLFNMSHDIRTPINAITGYTHLLEMNMDNKEKMRNYIEKIRYSSDFLLSLINNVLEMSRIESGKMELDETLWSVDQLNNTISSVFDEQIRQKKLKFISKKNVTHPDIICDELKLKQVYLNVISNAIKYTPEGGSITMELDELPCDRQGFGLYRCVVSDTGIGMSEEYLSHIFEAFTRENSSTESRTVGSGLGMAIVKNLVDFMGGRWCHLCPYG